MPQRVDLARVRDTFCDTTCAVAHKGASLYRDDNHLSDLGARRLIERVLAPVLLQRLAEAGR